MTRHNAHVLKWYRWQHYWAVEERRILAQFIWAHAFNSDDYQAFAPVHAPLKVHAPSKPEARQPAQTQPGSYRHEGVHAQVERISLERNDK
jgi:hypothetical protein